MRRTLAPLLLASLVACGRSDPAARDQEHDHGSGGHEHGVADAHAHEEAEEGPTTAFTLFTPTHELFVELDVPVAGQRGSFHAHVTRLADNAPATWGRFTVSFQPVNGSGASATTFSQDGAARPGIFTPRGAAPAQVGRHRLSFRYEAGDEMATWDAGEIEVGTKPIEPEPQPEGDITFLKETSWTLPFRIAKPTTERIARTVVVAARVEADPRGTSVLAAPAAGRVLWEAVDSVSLQGSQVTKGQVLGRLVPTSGHESWNASELALRQARIESERAASELARVGDLVARGLLPDRRLTDAQADSSRAAAALHGAEADARTRAGSETGVPLRAAAAGIVTELVAGNGAAVREGEPLARIAQGDAVIVRGTLRGVPSDAVIDPARASVLPAGTPEAFDLVEAGGVPLPSPGIVDARLAGIPVAWRVPADKRLRIGEAVELRVAIGAAEERLTIPLSAIVEINTRPSAFVQRTGESFERRTLTLGPSDGRRVAVLEGLGPDDWVVTGAGFDVYVASLSGTVESHRH